MKGAKPAMSCRRTRAVCGRGSTSSSTPRLRRTLRLDSATLWQCFTFSERSLGQYSARTLTRKSACGCRPGLLKAQFPAHPPLLPVPHVHHPLGTVLRQSERNSSNMVRSLNYLHDTPGNLLLAAHITSPEWLANGFSPKLHSNCSRHEAIWLPPRSLTHTPATCLPHPASPLLNT